MLDEFREAVRATEPYYLCLGNCYILTVRSSCENLLDLPAYYINLQGASDRGLYCYSLLEQCHGVLLFSAWANIASVATTKYFHHWRKILDELLMIGCLVVVVEAPMSQKHFRDPETGRGVSLDALKKKRSHYVQEVIGATTHPSLIFRDMADVVGYDSDYLVDRCDNKTPWNLSRTAIRKVARYFVKVIIKDGAEEVTL